MVSKGNLKGSVFLPGRSIFNIAASMLQLAVWSSNLHSSNSLRCRFFNRLGRPKWTSQMDISRFKSSTGACFTCHHPGSAGDCKSVVKTRGRMIPSWDLTHPLKKRFLEDDVPFPEVGYVSFWEGIKYQSIFNTLSELKLWKSFLLSHLGCVFPCFCYWIMFCVHFTSKCCVSYGVCNFHHQLVFLPKCCVPYGFYVLFEMFFMIFLHQVDIQFHCPVSFCLYDLPFPVIFPGAAFPSGLWVGPLGGSCT